MKKITVLMALCLSALILHAEEPVPTVTTLWQKTVGTSTLPSWFKPTTSRTRCIGASNEYVFLTNRDDGNHIFVYDRATGDSVAKMNTADLSLGTFALSDIGVTEDGKIIVCNLGANTNFKLYMYDNITAAPTTILHIPEAAPGGRTGDLMNVIGDYSKGTAKIYTATAVAASEIYVLGMADGVWKTEREFISTMSGVTAGSGASVAPKPDGEIYWKASGQSFKRMKADKTIDELGAGFSPYSNSLKYLGYSASYNLDYFALYTYGANRECADIVSMEPGNLYTCKILGRTPSLRTNANVGGTGDVAVRYDENFNPLLYVVSTDNGFGAYKIDGLAISQLTILNPVNINEKLTIYPDPTSNDIKISEMATSVKIFNITGQLVKDALITNTVDVSGFHGIYIMNIETINGNAIKKVIIK